MPVLIGNRSLSYPSSTLCREMPTSVLDCCPSVFSCQTLSTLKFLRADIILTSNFVSSVPHIEEVFNQWLVVLVFSSRW